MSNVQKIGESGEMTFKYEWKIRGFFSYVEEETSYRSPYFHVSNTAWFLQIWPNSSNRFENCTGYVPLFLHSVSNIEPETVQFSLGIQTTTAVKFQKESMFKERGLGWPQFVKKSELLENKSELVSSDVLRVVCFIKMNDTAPAIIAEHGKLAEDLKKLFMSSESTDVTLNLKNKTFAAHKSILAARSTVFAAKFKNEKTENKPSVVNIFGCNEDAFNVFLLFLYSGEVDYSKCNLCELYKICDKYEVLELKLICVDLMIKKISVENFVERLILSYKFDERELSSEIQGFFNENFKNIVASDAWKDLYKQNFGLANNLLKNMSSKVIIAK